MTKMRESDKHEHFESSVSPAAMALIGYEPFPHQVNH
jgi:hypothetical protein